MSRYITEVIEEILVIIPLEEITLIKQLTEYKNNLWNQAPESLLLSYNWIPVQNILNNNIKDINIEWKLQVLKIFNAK